MERRKKNQGKNYDSLDKFDLDIHYFPHDSSMLSDVSHFLVGFGKKMFLYNLGYLFLSLAVKAFMII